MRLPGYLYIGNPYTHIEKSIMEKRYDTVCRVCTEFFDKGIHVFSPIAHWHVIADCYEMGKDIQEWREYDRVMLGNSRGLVVVQSPGWADSEGLTQEMIWAYKEFNLPVFYLNPNIPFDQFLKETYSVKEKVDKETMINFVCGPR